MENQKIFAASLQLICGKQFSYDKQSFLVELKSGFLTIDFFMLRFIYCRYLLKYLNLTNERSNTNSTSSHSTPVDPRIQGMCVMMMMMMMPMRLMRPHSLPILFTAVVGAFFRFLRVLALNGSISLRFSNVRVTAATCETFTR